MCALSSHSEGSTVNEGSGFVGFHSPPRDPPRRRISLRTFIQIERRILREPVRTASREPIPEPPEAAATLRALACRFKAGDRASLRQIADVAGITLGAAGSVRRWARSVDRWPYRDSLGFGMQGQGQARPVRRKGGAPCLPR